MQTITLTMAQLPAVAKKTELETVHNNKTRYRLLGVAKVVNKILCDQDTDGAQNINYQQNEKDIIFEMEILRKLPIDCLLKYSPERFTSTIKGFEKKDFQHLNTKEDNIMAMIENIAGLYTLPIEYIFNEAWEYFSQRELTDDNLSDLYYKGEKYRYHDYNLERGYKNDKFNTIYKPKIDILELEYINKDDFDIVLNCFINFEILGMAKLYNTELVNNDKLHDLKLEFMHVDSSDTIQYELDKVKEQFTEFCVNFNGNQRNESRLKTSQEFKRRLIKKDTAIFDLIELVAICYDLPVAKFRKIVLSYKPFNY